MTKRNCKPGDLALIVDAYNPENIGTILKVIKPHWNQRALTIEAGDFLWTAEAPRQMTYARSNGKLYFRKKGPVPDSLLRPIRGNPLGADLATGVKKFVEETAT